MSAASGDLFVFLNKRATQVRLLFWERNGLCLIAKSSRQAHFVVSKKAPRVTHTSKSMRSIWPCFSKESKPRLSDAANDLYERSMKISHHSVCIYFPH